MYWQDEGYLLSKNNFNENSIIIETFTLRHGKCSGIVYGGSSRKQKRFFQVGNKLLLNFKSKNENKIGYFNTELFKAISPSFFDDKRKTICLLSACTFLKILLPERQINTKIYSSFEKMLDFFNSVDWINRYIYWELFLIKELGYEIDFNNNKKNTNATNVTIEINGKYFKIPNFYLKQNVIKFSRKDTKEALQFNKNIILENFILPNHLSFPISRNILEKYYI
ncbi:MAG: DNA repair protein RecO [Pelagibacteraceae bacterium]|jgi:DNA repair protein RecO (recombination protein O)|nr:DNA repair protein RecO [Candidatus Pelagibacter sp.]MDP6680109.1 DNA repair protein RecO [Pelagibacteraceae bacterium]MDP6710199.1 DNA repair protein RecO [Pelagibacteraceae bacterium]|tara:strand:+ start:733 stop:1404 length:672 start_codon:yes stop_codon:yes gene_type:complete